jgi:hypothetical protein
VRSIPARIKGANILLLKSGQTLGKGRVLKAAHMGHMVTKGLRKNVSKSIFVIFNLFPMKIVAQKIWATSVIFNKLYRVNNRPIGENSPNLVTLVIFSPRTQASQGNLNQVQLLRLED